MSFKKFLEERPDLFFTNTVPLEEDLSGNRKKSKMVELEKLLKKMDFYYQYIDGNYREWKKYNDMSISIRKLVDEIGKDGTSLYKQYVTKSGIHYEHRDTSPTPEKVNEVKERHSIFPEMNQVERKGNLGYTEGTVLPDGGHHFVDSPFDTCGEKWTPPKPRKY